MEAQFLHTIISYLKEMDFFGIMDVCSSSTSFLLEMVILRSGRRLRRLSWSRVWSVGLDIWVVQTEGKIRLNYYRTGWPTDTLTGAYLRHLTEEI
jgi:hypothetical protein